MDLELKTRARGSCRISRSLSEIHRTCTAGPPPGPGTTLPPSQSATKAFPEPDTAELALTTEICVEKLVVAPQSRSNTTAFNRPDGDVTSDNASFRQMPQPDIID